MFGSIKNPFLLFLDKMLDAQMLQGLRGQRPLRPLIKMYRIRHMYIPKFVGAPLLSAINVVLLLTFAPMYKSK